MEEEKEDPIPEAMLTDRERILFTKIYHLATDGGGRLLGSFWKVQSGSGFFEIRVQVNGTVKKFRSRRGFPYAVDGAGKLRKVL